MSLASISTQNELRAAFDELDAITRTPGKLSAEQQKRSSYLLAKISALKSGSLATDGEERNARADAMSIELRASQELRSIILGEKRALVTTNAGFLIPTQFEARLLEMQMAIGPLYAGSPAVSNVETESNGPRKMPLTDDTSATAYVQTETGAPTAADLAVSQVSMGTSTFSSGLVLLSNELIQDTSGWTTGEKVLQSSLAKRLSRIQNKTFLQSLLTTLGSNASVSIAAAGTSPVPTDIVNLIGAVNAQYRYSDRAAFLMNSITQSVLGNLKESTGRPIFKHVMAAKPTLLDYSVFVTPYADSIASTKNPIIFGDWSYVFIRHIPGIELQVMRQRYAEQFSTAFIARKRADMQYAVPTTADSPLKYMHIN